MTEHKSVDERLDPELKAQWVGALRSGRYTQGKYRLERDGRYCCLGVLQALRHIPKDEEEDILEPLAATKLGLGYATQCWLAVMNDRGQTFEQIADYIEDAL